MPSPMDGRLQTRVDELGRLERAWQDEGLWSRNDGCVGSVQRPLFLVNMPRAAERPGVARTTTICRGDRRHFCRVEGRCATSTVPMEKVLQRQVLLVLIRNGFGGERGAMAQSAISISHAVYRDDDNDNTHLRWMQHASVTWPNRRE